MSPTLHDSMALARRLFDGVLDCTDTPYIEHLLWVMRALPDDVTDEDRHLAMLQDAIESCQSRLALLMQANGITFEPRNTIAYLDYFRRLGYSNYVVDGLLLLTRSMWSMGHVKYVQNLVTSNHRGAMLVKYWTDRHNSDPERLARVRPEQQRFAAGLASRARRSAAILAMALGLEPI